VCVRVCVNVCVFDIHGETSRKTWMCVRELENECVCCIVRMSVCVCMYQHENECVCM